LQEPWFVENVIFEADKKLSDIFVSFQRGAKFSSPDPENQEKFKVHDTVQKVYRRLNFFEHECHIHCRLPRDRKILPVLICLVLYQIVVVIL